tara:strand:+ start:51 stop:155 length:105 start_codon:yes stop_codon:yes gene_type:complete
MTQSDQEFEGTSMTSEDIEKAIAGAFKKYFKEKE